MKVMLFWQICTLTCNTHVKVTFFMKTWNDPAVITDILPQAVSPKPIIKVKLLTKVSKSIVPKVWDSFPGQYSIIWRNSCGKINDNSIRTRWAWSQGSRNPKNQEFILEALKAVTVRPTKDEMQFAYIVLHQGLNLNPQESILESIKLK